MGRQVKAVRIPRNDFVQICLARAGLREEYGVMDVTGMSLSMDDEDNLSVLLVLDTDKSGANGHDDD